MKELIVMTAIEILGKAAAVAITVAGAWLMAKLAENKNLANITAATDEAVDVAVETAAALQQKFAEKWKAANEDGKLTEEEISALGNMLLETAMRKLSEPAKKILTAAGKDITAIIQDAAEAWILSWKSTG